MEKQANKIATVCNDDIQKTRSLSESAIGCKLPRVRMHERSPASSQQERLIACFVQASDDKYIDR